MREKIEPDHRIIAVKAIMGAEVEEKSTEESLHNQSK